MRTDRLGDYPDERVARLHTAVFAGQASATPASAQRAHGLSVETDQPFRGTDVLAGQPQAPNLSTSDTRTSLNATAVAISGSSAVHRRPPTPAKSTWSCMSSGPGWRMGVALQGIGEGAAHLA